MGNFNSRIESWERIGYCVMEKYRFGQKNNRGNNCLTSDLQMICTYLTQNSNRPNHQNVGCGNALTNTHTAKLPISWSYWDIFSVEAPSSLVTLAWVKSSQTSLSALMCGTCVHLCSYVCTRMYEARGWHRVPSSITHNRLSFWKESFTEAKAHWFVSLPGQWAPEMLS